MKIQIAGFDPSLSNWGYAIGSFDTTTNVVDIHDIGVISPENKKAKNVRKNSLDIERAEMLSDQAFQLLITNKPSALFVEVPVGSQSARAMASYGICIGLLGAIRSQIPVSVFEISPSEVKVTATNSKTASKTEMIDWAVSLYPSINWPRHRQQITVGKAEHIADAIGAIHAGINSSHFKQYINLFSSINQE